MFGRAVLARPLQQARPSVGYLRFASAATARKVVQHPTTTPGPSNVAPSPELKPSKPLLSESWLTRFVRRNPTAKRTLLGLMTLFGYNSPKQIAGWRAFYLYEYVCAVKGGEEKDFWQNECHLPPTFQSWFTVTNLHVWLLTVRLRALPDPIGKHYIQALIDHFFYDVEDRIRAVLQPSVPKQPRLPPPAASATPISLPVVQAPPFYTIPSRENMPKGNAPERLVSRQMKILKEQWAGLGLSFDLALVRSDAEMAAAVWRNLLGARGARGIVYPDSPEAGTLEKPYFRRSVNLVGGEIEKVSRLDKKGLEAEEARDDGSGVHDFPPSEAGLYVQYPELMADIVAYCRRELVRLENIPDDVIEGKSGEGIDALKFGRVRR